MVQSVRTPVVLVTGLQSVTGLHGLHGSVLEIVVQDVQPGYSFYALRGAAALVRVRTRGFTDVAHTCLKTKNNSMYTSNSMAKNTRDG